MLLYITSNKDKAASAKWNLSPFGIEFETQHAELIEIQSDSMKEIALDKAKRAFETIQEPLFITDHGWYIPALNGFPGPYMKYINQWFTSEDLLHLMQDKADRTIIKREVLVYVDNDGMQHFTAEIKGRILTAPEGEGYPAMRITTLSKSGKSMSRCQEEGINSFDENHIYEEFALWLKANNKV